LIAFSCETDKKQEGGEEVAETRFCWICSFHMTHKTLKCGNEIAVSGENLAKTTKCDYTVEEIRSYEISQSNTKTTETSEMADCQWGPKPITKVDILTVTCLKKTK